MHPPILNPSLGGKGSIRAAGWARKPQLHRQLRVSSRIQNERLPVSRRPVCQWLERFGLELSILLQQNFYLALSLFQLFSAGRGKLHALFKESQRFLKRDFSLLQLLHDLFQSLETLFELRQRMNSLSFYRCSDFRFVSSLF